MERESTVRFLEYYGKIHRDGAAQLLEWLKGSDFFEAPASTKYHLAVPEGLCIHSIHVYERVRALYQAEKKAELTEAEEEKLAVIGLLHDVCKADFYICDYKNQKTYDPEKVAAATRWDIKHDARGDFIWETVPYYRIDDEFPYGHGEKSVLLIEKYMRLTDEERMCIRWHMGFSDDTFRGGSQTVGNAFEKYPLAVLLNCADMLSAYLDEGENGLFPA